MNDKSKKIKGLNRGMTYVELIVVMGIFSIMAGVVFFKYADFGRQIDLQNLSQDIALQIVQAQKIALAGKQPNATEAGSALLITDWKPAYGVYFSTATPMNPNPNNFANNALFIPFIDAYNFGEYIQGTCATDVNGPSSECMNLISIGKGDYIRSLCVGDSDLAVDCSNGTQESDLYVTFTRPDSSAVISNVSLGGNPQPKAIITISSHLDNAFTKYITVYGSGRVETN